MTTKRISIALLSIFVVVIAFAANKDLEKDITMVSYEQRWLDYNGTLALKNNSSVEVKNVVFMITYLDMAGNELDYEEFARNVSIAPGMTKKIDVPAYEHSRSYHYYKSEDRPGGSPAFKIKFQLKDYNVVKVGGVEELDEEYADSIREMSLDEYDDVRLTESEGLFSIMLVVIAFVFISITVGLYVLVAVMAQRRNRSVVAWILLSLIGTPLLMVIILLVIGNNDNYFENQ